MLDHCRRVLHRPGSPEEVLRFSYDRDRDAFEAFVTVLSCTYVQSEKVRASLGYPGQVPVRRDDRDADLDVLLAPVRERGDFLGRTQEDG